MRYLEATTCILLACLLSFQVFVYAKEAKQRGLINPLGDQTLTSWACEYVEDNYWDEIIGNCWDVCSSKEIMNPETGEKIISSVNVNLVNACAIVLHGGE